MIEQGLYQLLTTAPSITAIVGTRVYPVILPNDVTLPAITYKTTTTAPDYTNDGPVGCIRACLQIGAWSDSYLTSKNVTEAIRTVLDGYKGTLPDGTVVLNVMRANVADYFEKDSRLFRTQTDWTIIYAE